MRCLQLFAQFRTVNVDSSREGQSTTVHVAMYTDTLCPGLATAYKLTQIWLTTSHTAVLSSLDRSLLCRPADVIAKATDLSCCTSSMIDSSAALTIAPSTRVVACLNSGARALTGAMTESTASYRLRAPQIGKQLTAAQLAAFKPQQPSCCRQFELGLTCPAWQ